MSSLGSIKMSPAIKAGQGAISASRMVEEVGRMATKGRNQLGISQSRLRKEIAFLTSNGFDINA